MTLTDDQETIVNGNDPVSLIKRKRAGLEQMKERFAKLLLGAVTDYIVEFVPNGRESLGDAIYKNITVEFFDPRQFLSTMDLSS
ncbi:Rho guanine nucleotide exchange factor 8-like protein, partial [Tanacetum coccineum]